MARQEMIARLAVALFLALAFPPSSFAGGDWPPCGHYTYAPPDTAFRNCILTRAGAEPIERYRQHGDEIIRVMIGHFMYIEPPFAIAEIILPRKGGDGIAILRDARARGVNRTYRFPRAAFGKMRDLVLHVWRLDTAQRARLLLRHASAESLETICIDPANAWFQAWLGGRVMENEFDGCQTGFDLAFHFLEFAISLDPPCQELSAHGGMWALKAPHYCLRFRNDRMLSAKALRAAYALANVTYRGGEPKRTDLAPLVEDRVTMGVDGRTLTGVDDIIEHWPNVSFEQESVSNDGRVATVRDVMVRDDKEGPDREVRYEAPTIQIWRRGADGAVRLHAWTVGKFVRINPSGE